MRPSSFAISRKVFIPVIALGAVALAGTAFPGELAYERVIDLEGTSNTRDIGGYLTADQRTLRWGQIIRSENLSRLTAEDFRKLEQLGIKTVIDLRTEREHEQAPTVWIGDQAPTFHHFPIGDARNDWFRAQRRMMQRSRFTEAQSLEHMENGYRMIAEEGLPSLRQALAVVLDESNWPVLIHCTAGKDRSGVAVALILEALGVDRQTIMDEYLLTNEISRAGQKAALLEKQRSNGHGGRSWRGPSAEAWLPIVGVQPEMLEAFYANVEDRFGSMDAYLDELGVDRAARSALAMSLTAKPPQLVLVE